MKMTERDVKMKARSDRDLAIENHSDLYKETHGFRPRVDWTGVLTRDIEDAYRALLFDEECVQ
jgi:hypothetical protein